MSETPGVGSNPGATFDTGAMTDAAFLGDSDNAYAGRRVSAAGDMDLDGKMDLLISSWGEGTQAGATYLIYSPY